MLSALMLSFVILNVIMLSAMASLVVLVLVQAIFIFTARKFNRPMENTLSQ
jgi:hypothetical protein